MNVVPRLIDATTTSTSTWHFSYAEHVKLIIKVERVRLCPEIYFINLD